MRGVRGGERMGREEKGGGFCGRDGQEGEGKVRGRGREERGGTKEERRGNSVRKRGQKRGRKQKRPIDVGTFL